MGTPREIYYHPASEFVTTFIGDTNRMTESLITQLNEQNKGAGLNPSDHIYVRVENVKESVHAGEENRYYKLQARFETEEFYGITTRRTFLAGDTEIKSVNTKNDESWKKARRQFCTSTRPISLFSGRVRYGEAFCELPV